MGVFGQERTGIRVKASRLHHLTVLGNNNLMNLNIGLCSLPGSCDFSP